MKKKLRKIKKKLKRGKFQKKIMKKLRKTEKKFCKKLRKTKRNFAKKWKKFCFFFFFFTYFCGPQFCPGHNPLFLFLSATVGAHCMAPRVKYGIGIAVILHFSWNLSTSIKILISFCQCPRLRRHLPANSMPVFDFVFHNVRRWQSKSLNTITASCYRYQYFSTNNNSLIYQPIAAQFINQ